jgi:carboxylesterase type B
MDIENHGDLKPTRVIDATQRGPTCVQGIPFWRQTSSPSGSEDCLLLDVLVPKTPTSDYVPVLVQIHGGGYDQGNSQSNPGYLLVNQSMSNMIYVSIQYRLAAFGFLSSTEIRENGAANVGLLDQRAALGWVQRNIRAFGGDPSAVTIIGRKSLPIFETVANAITFRSVGGSAGGGSVMDQLILYGGVSNPPFRAAISEYPWWQSYKNNTILEAQYRQMLTATNCDNLACLRGQSTQTLIDAMQASLISYGWESYYGWGDFYYGRKSIYLR